MSALKGRLFNQQWNGKTLHDLYNYVHDQMPLGQAGALNSQEYADIVAYILSQSGVPAGNEKLTPKSPMDRVLSLSAGGNATGAQAAAATAPVKLGELLGSLKQPSTHTPTQAELDRADSATGNWLMYNKGYRGERYSLLNQINVDNAATAAGVHVPAR